MNNELYRMLVRLAVKEARTITDDAKALEFKPLYKEWHKQIGNTLVVNEYVQYDNKLYKVLQIHTAQEAWTPADAPSLFAEVLVDPSGENILQWQQPDSTNAYMTGDKVNHNGKTYVSVCDNNVWESGVYGWEEIVE